MLASDSRCDAPQSASSRRFGFAFTFDGPDRIIHLLLQENAISTKATISGGVCPPGSLSGGGGGPAALPAGLKVTQGTVKAAVDPNTKRLLSHLCFLSVPVVTHVFALSICQLVHVPPSAGAAAASSHSGVGAFCPGWLVCCDKRSSCPLTLLPHGAQPRRLLLDREIRE